MFLKNVIPGDDGILIVDLLVNNKELAAAANNAHSMADVELLRTKGHPLYGGTHGFLGISIFGPDAPPVARDGLIRLRLFHAEHAIEPFYRLAKQYDGQDHFYRAALNIACGTDPKRRDAILADFDKHFPEWNDKVADLVWELRPKSILPRLEKLLDDPKLTVTQRARIVDILAVNDDPAAGQTLLAVLKSAAEPEVKARAIDSLKQFLPTKWKGLQNSKEFGAAIDELLKDAKLQAAAVQLISAAGLADRINDLIAIVKDEKALLDIRKEAIRALGKMPGDLAANALIAAALPENPLSFACIEALANFLPNTQVFPHYQNNARELIWGSIFDEKSKRSVEFRLACVAAMSGNRRSCDFLIDRHTKGLLPNDLAADTGRLLRNSPFADIRNKALIAFPPPGKLDIKKLPSIAVLAKRQGNIDKGRLILSASLKNEAQCLKCHTVRGIGGQVGPDLSMIGKKASRENLIESILYPSKAIADQFIQWRIETKKGLDISGLLIEETPTELLLRDANAKDYRIAKSEIESRTKSAVSIMPENIIAALTEDELTDVVEYMLTLKTASLTPDFWNIVGPFANDQSDSGLDTVYEPERTVDLTATYKGKASGGRQSPEIKWTRVLRNADGYVDLMAHFAPNSTQIMSYLYREIESPVDQEATIALGTDDGSKLWLNGEKVYETRAHDAAVPEKARVTVKLKKGKNTMLLKIVNGNNPHGFYLTILCEHELKAGK
jgi:putative heme-binding domain-containing protein